MNKFQNNRYSFLVWFKVMFSLILILASVNLDAQQLRKSKRNKPKTASEMMVASPKVRKAQQKKAKEDEKRRKEADKARAKAQQDHINMQSPEVRERMKQSEKESGTYRKKSNTPFYKKWFRKKRR